jgi:hypothetical protein
LIVWDRSEKTIGLEVSQLMATVINGLETAEAAFGTVWIAYTIYDGLSDNIVFTNTSIDKEIKTGKPKTGKSRQQKSAASAL